MLYRPHKGENGMREELGICGGTVLIGLSALHFVVKWAVRNGVKEAYKEIVGKEAGKKNSDKEKSNENQKNSDHRR